MCSRGDKILKFNITLPCLFPLCVVVGRMQLSYTNTANICLPDMPLKYMLLYYPWNEILLQGTRYLMPTNYLVLNMSILQYKLDDRRQNDVSKKIVRIEIMTPAVC